MKHSVKSFCVHTKLSCSLALHWCRRSIQSCLVRLRCIDAVVEGWVLPQQTSIFLTWKNLTILVKSNWHLHRQIPFVGVSRCLWLKRCWEVNLGYCPSFAFTMMLSQWCLHNDAFTMMRLQWCFHNDAFKQFFTSCPPNMWAGASGSKDAHHQSQHRWQICHLRHTDVGVHD